MEMDEKTREVIDLIQDAEELLYLYRLTIINYYGDCGLPTMRAQTKAVAKMKELLERLKHDGCT